MQPRVRGARRLDPNKIQYRYPTQGDFVKRVTGIGGIFFKAKDPKALYDWYRQHLGIESAPDNSGAMWRDADHPE